MGNKSIISLLVLIACMGWASSAQASGYTDTYGFGCRAMSMGGAFTAVADDFSAAYYNQAGLGQIKGNHFALEYFYTAPNIDVKTADGAALVINDALGEVRNDPTEASAGNGLDLGIPEIGVVLDLTRIAKLPFQTTLGIAASLPEKFDVGYQMHSFAPDQPHFIRYGDEIDRLTIALGLGIEAVKDIVYIGGGAQAMLYGPGAFYVHGMGVAGEGNVESKSEFGALLKFAPTFGLLFTPLDKHVRIGLAWKEKEEIRMGPVPISAIVTLGALSLTIPMTAAINCYYTPEEYSAGLAFDLDPLLVSFEVNKQMWSDYAYSASDSPNFEGPDFEDTYNYRVGLEYRLNKKTSLMAGFYRQPSPVPDQSGRVTNYIDLDKDCFTLGASYIVDPELLLNIPKKPVKVACNLQYQKLKSLDVVDKADVEGISWIDQEDYTVEGKVLAGGVSMSLTW